MGLDWRCVAAPLDAGPVRAIRADADLWETAVGHPPFGSARDGEPLPDISRELLAVLPAGTGWIHRFGGRSYQQAEYLLDPVVCRNAQTWEERERALPYRIVHGEETFAEHGRDVQGVLWRCSTTAFLAQAVQRIDMLDVAGARREFSVAEMVDLGVYKVSRDEPDERAFARVLADLRAFADICRTVVTQDLGMIISLW